MRPRGTDTLLPGSRGDAAAPSEVRSAGHISPAPVASAEPLSDAQQRASPDTMSLTPRLPCSSATVSAPGDISGEWWAAPLGWVCGSPAGHAGDSWAPQASRLAAVWIAAAAGDSECKGASRAAAAGAGLERSGGGSGGVVASPLAGGSCRVESTVPAAWAGSGAVIRNQKREPWENIT